MRKKILILNTSFRYEGPNDVMWQLVRHVDSSRFEIIFGCMHKGGPMEEIYQDAGYQTHNFKMERLTDLRVILQVRDFVKSENIDLVMAQLLRAEVFGGYGVRLARVPLILVIQNIDTYRAKPWLFPHYYLSRLCLRWPVKIVAASEHVRQFVQRHQGVKPEKIVTIHGGVDYKHFFNLSTERDKVRCEFGWRSDEIIIGTVARYDRQKGLPYLLEAFTLLKARYENIRLILVGDGPLREELSEWVKSRNLEEQVLLMGFRRDYDRIIHGFDIFVLPSLWEGLPLVLLASMASAKPVVATNVSGIPEALEDGISGLLVGPADFTALAKMIEKLICDPHLRRTLGTNARKRVEQIFSARVMADKYQLLWNDCLGNVSWEDGFE